MIVYSSMNTKPTLASLLAELSSEEGVRPSCLPGVKFMRSTENWPRVPVTYEPGIVIIAQGKKRGHLGGQTFNYDANNYLVLSVPLPFECDTEGSKEEPMLGVFVSVNPSTVAELLMEMRDLPPITEPQALAVRSYPLDEELADTTLRLLLSLRNDNDARILGPQIIREMIYRVLLRERSGTLPALATPHSHFGQIRRALNKMHAEYAKPVDITTLASEAGMSVSTFHGHFKAVTSSPPLRYLKSIRLQKARMLMAHEGLTASIAAREVGYESASQFSREFKRYFGNTPAAVAEEMRAAMIRL
jgi:AraC-like DNA-binding protein